MALTFNPVTGLPIRRRRTRAPFSAPATAIPAPGVPQIKYSSPAAQLFGAPAGIGGAPPAGAVPPEPGPPIPSRIPTGGLAEGSAPISRVDLGRYGGLFTDPAAAAGTPARTPADDLRAQIDADPLYLQFKADMSAEDASSIAQRQAAVRRAVILSDLFDPSQLTGGLSGLSGDVDPMTVALARENTKAGISTRARLDKAHTDADTGIVNSLAARGMLDSGETGYHMKNEDLGYRQNTFDAVQQLLDYLSQAEGSYLDSARQRQRDLANAAAEAAGRLNPDLYGNDPAAVTDLGDRPGYGPPTGVYSGAPANNDYWTSYWAAKRKAAETNPWTAGL